MQTSVSSQTSPADPARQIVPEGWKLSGGQVGLEPVQNSSTSQMPAMARHPWLDGWNAFAGQVLLVPSQASATSHTPAAARQVVPNSTF